MTAWAEAAVGWVFAARSLSADGATELDVVAEGGLGCWKVLGVFL